MNMYGNDLDVGTYSSAFPLPEDEFGQHPWNLNQVECHLVPMIRQRSSAHE
jgi:hypothetical protein